MKCLWFLWMNDMIYGTYTWEGWYAMKHDLLNDGTHYYSSTRLNNLLVWSRLKILIGRRMGHRMCARAHLLRVGETVKWITLNNYFLYRPGGFHTDAGITQTWPLHFRKLFDTKRKKYCWMLLKLPICSNIIIVWTKDFLNFFFVFIFAPSVI